MQLGMQRVNIALHVHHLSFQILHVELEEAQMRSGPPVPVLPQQECVRLLRHGAPQDPGFEGQRLALQAGEHA